MLFRSWLLSKIHYEAAKPPYRVPPREMVRLGRFFELDGLIGQADLYAQRYCKDVQRWVRVEHLISDFERCFADLMNPKALRLALANLEQVRNASSIGYLQRHEFFFTPQELAHLYETNPVWTAMEERLYGGVLTL